MYNYIVIHFQGTLSFQYNFSGIFVIERGNDKDLYLITNPRGKGYINKKIKNIEPFLSKATRYGLPHSYKSEHFYDLSKIQEIIKNSFTVGVQKRYIYYYV